MELSRGSTHPPVGRCFSYSFAVVLFFFFFRDTKWFSYHAFSHQPCLLQPQLYPVSFFIPWWWIIIPPPKDAQKSFYIMLPDVSHASCVSSCLFKKMSFVSCFVFVFCGGGLIVPPENKRNFSCHTFSLPSLTPDMLQSLR